MNEKEISEIRRRFRHDKSNIQKIRGCYVNEKVTKEDIEAIPSDICNSATISVSTFPASTSFIRD